VDLSSDGLLECLAVDLRRELCKLKRFSPDEATQIAVDIAEKVRVGWAGQTLYVPRGNNKNMTARDEAIFAEFNGRNYQALAQKNGVSVMRIRQIIKRQLDFRRTDALPARSPPAPSEPPRR